MANFLDKVMNIMGFSAIEDDDLFEDANVAQKEADPYAERRSSNFRSTAPAATSRQAKQSSRVVNIHTTTQMKVVVTTPESYTDAQEISDHIKSKKPVVVNLESTNKENAQKIMDFLSGACYALNGSIQRVAGNIFIIAPENIDIAGNIKEELKTRGIILPWVK